MYISFSDASPFSNPSQLFCNISILLKSFSTGKPSQCLLKSKGFSVLKSKMDLRRYFYWEESEKVSTDVEHILHLRRSWEGISIWEGWIFSNILIWEGIEKVFFLRRTWEAWNYYRVVEMDLRRWDGSEKEMYPPTWIGHLNIYLILSIMLALLDKSFISPLTWSLSITNCEYLACIKITDWY